MLVASSFSPRGRFQAHVMAGQHRSNTATTLVRLHEQSTSALTRLRRQLGWMRSSSPIVTVHVADVFTYVVAAIVALRCDWCRLSATALTQTGWIRRVVGRLSFRSHPSYSFWKFAVIQGDDLFRPHKQVARSLAGRVRLAPQFKVFRAIILSYAVLVMNNFLAQQWSADQGAHDKPMFKDVMTFVSHRITDRANHPISVRATQLPSVSIVRFRGSDPRVTTDETIRIALVNIAIPIRDRSNLSGLSAAALALSRWRLPSFWRFHCVVDFPSMMRPDKPRALVFEVRLPWDHFTASAFAMDDFLVLAVPFSESSVRIDELLASTLTEDLFPRAPVSGSVSRPVFVHELSLPETTHRSET